ncbi:hypothetical protein N9Y67_01980 [Pseudomonadota bacterium]|nr:hypothetical protein [Pseudomonadota bacterium]
MKQIIVSHGQKGGVGKSMIASLVANYLTDNFAKEKLLLVEGDTGIPDVALRYKNKIKTIGIPLQRGDMAVEALGELFERLENEFNNGVEIVLINLPAGAADTIDKHAVDLVAPVAEALGVVINITYAIGSGNESAKAAGVSLKEGLAGISDKRIAVVNSAMGEPAKMAWSRSTERDEWLDSGGEELVLPTLTPRIADRLHELEGTFSEIASGDKGELTVVDRMIMKSFIDKSSAITEGVVSYE